MGNAPPGHVSLPGSHRGQFLVPSSSSSPSVTYPGNTMALYADDSKIFRSIKTPADQLSFQQDLDSLHEWSEVNEMEFKIKKSKKKKKKSHCRETCQ